MQQSTMEHAIGNLTLNEISHILAFIRMLDRFPLIHESDVHRVLRDRSTRWNITVEILFGYMLCIGSLTIPNSKMVQQYAAYFSMEIDRGIRSYGLFPEFCLLRAAFYGFCGNAIDALKYCNLCYLEYTYGYGNSNRLIFAYLSLVKSFNTDPQQFLQDRTILKNISFFGQASTFVEDELKALLEFNPEQCRCGHHLRAPISSSVNIFKNKNTTANQKKARNFIFCIIPIVDDMTTYMHTYNLEKAEFNCFVSSAIDWIFDFLSTAPSLHEHDRLLYLWREYNSISFIVKCYTSGNFQRFIDRQWILFLLDGMSSFHSKYVNNSSLSYGFERVFKELASFKSGN